MSNILPVMLIVLLCPGLLHARGFIETVSVHYTKETADGKTFICKQEVVNGAVTDYWLVDNTPVGQMLYEQEIAQARVRDLQKEREELARTRLQNQSMQTAALRTGYKKMLAMQCERVDQILTRLEDVRVKPYLAFGAYSMGVCTITREQFDEIVQSLRKNATKLLVMDDEVAILELSQMVDLLEAVPDQLQKLFYASVDNAMVQCSDTKLLKELLELVVLVEK